MKATRKEAVPKSKHGINLRVYHFDTNIAGAGVVYVETEEGHFQEFYDKKSTFLYYIIEGEGTFYLSLPSKATDLIIAPPLTKIYYIGKFKMLLTTVPAWKPENEVQVRFIDKRTKK